MSIEHIPVFASPGDRDPIGFANLAHNKLEITLTAPLVAAQLESLFEKEDLKELYLGYGFIAQPSFRVRRRPE